MATSRLATIFHALDNMTGPMRAGYSRWYVEHVHAGIHLRYLEELDASSQSLVSIGVNTDEIDLPNRLYG